VTRFTSPAILTGGREQSRRRRTMPPISQLLECREHAVLEKGLIHYGDT
jgi:hypothetical protein